MFDLPKWFARFRAATALPTWPALLLLLLLPLLLLAGCRAVDAEDDLDGRLLIWHTWTNSEATALDNAIARFRQIHPDVNIKQQAFTDIATMLAEFQVAADAGLGPDLIIAPGQQIPPLANARLIDPVVGILDEATIQRTAPAALDALRYQEKLYGLPVTMDTLVLYYDTRLVETPATTLDGLLAEAAQDRVVAISTNFVDAFWGVQAFGGSLFDDEWRVILDRGGFANWLAWLKDARDTPGMILDSNREALRNRFVEHSIAYYVGYASEMGLLVEGKGEANVGVATLPAGPNGSAAPFLKTQGFLFSTVSSENQRRLAIELTTFVTNAEQQSSMMRASRLIPVNTRVRVNPRLTPVVASFAAQSRTAVPLYNLPQMDTVLQVGGDAYTRVLEGVLEPAEASYAVTTAINEVNGFAELATPQFECAGVGTVYLGYAIAPKREETLTRVLAQLRRDCPTVIVDAQPVTEQGLAERLSATLSSNGRLDLLMVPHRWIPPLVDEQQLHDLTQVIDAETLQRYRPVGVDAMRFRGGLYGLPATIDLDALYFNRALVNEPARTLEELRQQAADGVPIALATTFERGFWGIPAHGGTLPTGEEQLAFGNDSFAAWLAWLQAARDESGIVLSNDHTALENRFLEQKSAYYVAGPEVLQPLQNALGTDNLGVVPLPAGTTGDGGPLLRATGLLFSARLSATQLQLALEVANYITSVESQTIFMDMANQIPTNIGLNLPPELPLTAFVDQVRTAVLLANTQIANELLQLGDAAYLAVLQDGLPPTEAVDELWQALVPESAANEILADEEAGNEVLADEEAAAEEAADEDE